MRRIRLRTGPGALFAASLVVALIALLPMRLALGWFGLGEQGLTARAVAGSIWAGSLREARFGDIALGDLSAGVSPLQLLLGRARIELDGAAPAAASTSTSTFAAVPRLKGAITVSRSIVGLDHVTASLPVGDAFRPLPVTTLDLDDVSVTFRGQACDAASGRIRATMAGELGGAAVPTALAGTARCDGGALLLPLVSAAGNEGSTIRLWPDGRYTADLTLQPGDPAAELRLQAAGFVRTQAGMRLTIEGRF